MPKVIAEKKTRIHSQVQKQGKQRARETMYQNFLSAPINPTIFTNSYRHCI